LAKARLSLLFPILFAAAAAFSDDRGHSHNDYD
jgi:hypothetical protein